VQHALGEEGGGRGCLAVEELEAQHDLGRVEASPVLWEASPALVQGKERVKAP
jgi:hypothetical protein